MQALIVYSAIFFMPIFAFVFIVTLFTSLKRLKQGEELDGIEYICGVAFALMMWTLSGSIILNAM
jgi:hypothetical protein